jgi:hypothetical protein
MDFPTIFGLAHDDFLRDEIITERIIAENELAPLYYPGKENFYDKIHGLLPEYAIFNNIFRNTLTPKRGDHTSIRGSTRTLLLAILDNKPPPCISTFFWTEFMFMLQHGTIYVIYAPYIQRIINYKIDMLFEAPWILPLHPLLLLWILQLQPLLLLLPVHLLLLL